MTERELQQLASQINTHEVGAIAIFIHFCRLLKIDQFVDQHIPCNSKVKMGLLTIAMIIDVLCGRQPLYKVGESWSNKDSELYLGVESDLLNDDAFGRCLSRIGSSDNRKILQDISFGAIEHFNLSLDVGNFDTTSQSLYGEYVNQGNNPLTKHEEKGKNEIESTENNEEGEQQQQQSDDPLVRLGFSKDHRPDLKQIMFSLFCIEGNIPIIGGVINGNTSDAAANNTQLETIAQLIKEEKLKPKQTIYVADSKLVNEENLAKLGDRPFVTRLPATYAEHNRVIESALTVDQWIHVGAMAQTSSPNRPAANYSINEQTVTLYGKNYRAVVVKSTGNTQRQEKKYAKLKIKEKKEIDALTKKARKTKYHCEEDAVQALEKYKLDHKDYLWILDGTIQKKDIHKKGNAKKGQEREVIKSEYTIELKAVYDQQKEASKKQIAECFVLISNVPPKDDSEEEDGPKDNEAGAKHDAEGILRLYKQLHSIERDFSFLKNPLIVNSMFLKKAERIVGLGFILILALMVWNLVQMLLRRAVTKTPNLELKNVNKQKTDKPTSYLLKEAFKRVKIIESNGCRVLGKELTENQKEWLRALDLDASIFLKPVKSA